MNARNIALAIGVAVVSAGIPAGLAFWLTDPSASNEQEVASQACLSLGRRFFEGREVSVRGQWRKRGHVVTELFIAQPGATYGNVRLCIMPRQARDVTILSVFEQADWRR